MAGTDYRKSHSRTPAASVLCSRSALFLLSATAPLLQQWLSRTDHPDVTLIFSTAPVTWGGWVSCSCSLSYWSPFLHFTQSRLWAAGYVLPASVIATSILRNCKPVEQQSRLPTLQIIPDSTRTVAALAHPFTGSLQLPLWRHPVHHTEIAVVPIF